MLDLTPHTPEEAEDYCFRKIVVPSSQLHETLQLTLVDRIEDAVSKVWVIHKPTIYQTRIDQWLEDFTKRDLANYPLPAALWATPWQAKAKVTNAGINPTYSYWLECVGVPLGEAKNWSLGLRSELVSRRLKHVQATPEEAFVDNMRKQIAESLKYYLGQPITPRLKDEIVEACKQKVLSLGGNGFQSLPDPNGTLILAGFPDPVKHFSMIQLQMVLEIH